MAVLTVPFLPVAGGPVPRLRSRSPQSFDPADERGEDTGAQPATVGPASVLRGHSPRVPRRCTTAHPEPRRRLRAVIAFLIGLACFAGTGVAADVDHAPWDRLLKTHVQEGRVDYRGVAAERATLEQYLAAVAVAAPAQLPSKEAQLAFWINAYNACVFTGVLDHAPLTSVKDIKGFFEKLRYPVAGESLTLNEIEAKGRALGDWRIHVGVVCASHSCPTLRSEAYDAARLNEQLTEQMQKFLADTERGLRLDGQTLWVSSIFKWYAKDFLPQGRLTAETLLAVLAPYADPATVAAVRGKSVQLKFLDYDWSLNEQHH